MTKLLLLLLALAVLVPLQFPTAALAQQTPVSAGLALTPPMGWNTWNKFACNVSDELVRGNGRRNGEVGHEGCRVSICGD